MAYHPLSEQIVDILIKKVNNGNRHYFRILTAYYLSKVASMMRCNIETQDRGKIPVNTYVLNLMPSGAGKGHSTNILEREFINPFKRKFLSKVFPVQAAANITNLALEIANDKVTAGSMISHQEEFEAAKEDLEKQFARLGELAFSFDSGTTPAVKQMREKLLLAGAGSMNLELDEIGSNMSNNTEVLTTFLELYDIGIIKQKLIKNTTENVRSRELPGETPTNLMMFGTPSKLLDGGRIEQEFLQFLETGYARRLLVGYTNTANRPKQLSAKDRYRQMVDKSINDDVRTIANIFEGFADKSFNHIVQMTEEDAIFLIEYQMQCERKADQMKEHQAVHQAEMIHRYYKVLKLAGAYAFADNANVMTTNHLKYAINLVEDSGEQFTKMLERKGSYERLANYLADIDREVTQHELLEDLPFYKGSENQRKDMMSLAMSYGYRNNIVIKYREQDGISFYSGESLRETDLTNMQVSISTDITEGFGIPDPMPEFNDLHKLTTAKGYHYTAHGFTNNYRSGDNAIPGFNLLILDIDEGTSIETAKILLADYKFLISTTKRHTPEKHRYRLLMPISHHIKLNKVEYAKFMENVFDWFPFDVDQSTKDIARKWETYPGSYSYNDGEVLDGTQFIPETRKAEEMKTSLTSTGLNNMERWFKQHTARGNRATMLYRYGCVLIDNKLDLGDIVAKITNFNNELVDPLPEEELRNQTLKSLSKKHKGI